MISCNNLDDKYHGGAESPNFRYASTRKLFGLKANVRGAQDSLHWRRSCFCCGALAWCKHREPELVQLLDAGEALPALGYPR